MDRITTSQCSVVHVQVCDPASSQCSGGMETVERSFGIVSLIWERNAQTNINHGVIFHGMTMEF